MKPKVSRIAAMCLALIAQGAVAQTVESIDTIVLTTESAPGTSDDFALFGAALIDDKGKIALQSRLTPSNDESVWIWDSGGGLALLSRASFLDIDPTSLRFGDGGVAHGENETVVEILGPNGVGGLQLLASQGAAAPGGGTFDLSSTDEDEMAVSDGGVFFETEIDDGTNLRALFRQDAGFSLQEVFREGDLAPGTGGLPFVDFVDGVMNDQREMVFEAFLDLVGTRGLFGPAAGGETLLLKTGDEPLGVPGAQFRGFGADWETVAVNNAGEVAFSGNMIIGPGGVTALDETGIWAPGASSDFNLVARTGFAAPEVPNATFSGFDFLVLNSQGSVAFNGLLTGAGIDSSNNLGLWAARRGATPQLVAREGGAAPELPGRTLGTASKYQLGLNGNDQLVFAAELDDGSAAIWFYDLIADTVGLVLGPGDDVEVQTGDVRTVDKAWFGDEVDLEIHSGGEDGKKQVWNDAGQIAALVEFTDGSKGVLRLNLDVGPCTAPDGENLVLSNDTVTDTQEFEVCDTISVGPNYAVNGPNGDLTLRAGGSVVLQNGVSVGAGGVLTIENE